MFHCNCRTATLIAVLGLWSGVSTVFGQTELVPVDDAYVEQGTHSAADPDVIHGQTDPDRLWVRAATTLDRNTYLKFDLTKIDGTVSQAVLEFTVDVAIGSPEVHYIHVYALDDDSWSEDELTGNNAPARGSEIGVVEVAPQSSTDPDTTYSIVLTDYINGQIGGDKVASLVFANPTASTGDDADQTDVRFFSSEATLLGDGPLLILGEVDTNAERDEIPSTFSVEQNYPNPFNPATELRFEAPATGQLHVAVYDLLGKRVATLFEGRVATGEGSVTWSGLNDAGLSLGTGVYIARFDFEGQVTSVSMTLLR